MNEVYIRRAVQRLGPLSLLVGQTKLREISARRARSVSGAACSCRRGLRFIGPFRMPVGRVSDEADSIDMRHC